MPVDQEQLKFGDGADASSLEVDIGSFAKRSPEDRFSDDEEESSKWPGHIVRKQLRAGARKVAHKYGYSPPNKNASLVKSQEGATIPMRSESVEISPVKLSDLCVADDVECSLFIDDWSIGWREV